MYSQRSLLIVLIGAFLVLYFFIQRKKRYRYRKRYRNKGTGDKTIYRQRTHFNYSEAKTAEEKGVEGERFVATIELGRLPHDLFVVFNDVILPAGDGTTQVDHVVVADQGIFVIETKNYSGYIFADNYSQKWTQVLPGKKNQFQNPIRQNYLHVKAISNNLGIPEEFIHGIVAFSDKAEFKGEKPNGVVFFMQIPQAIKEKNKVILRKEEADDIVGAIREWNDSVTPEQRRNHVKNIHNRIAQKCS